MTDVIMGLWRCRFRGRARDDVHWLWVPDDVSKALRIRQRRSQHAGGVTGTSVGHVDGWLDHAPQKRHHCIQHH